MSSSLSLVIHLAKAPRLLIVDVHNVFRDVSEKRSSRLNIQQPNKCKQAIIRFHELFPQMIRFPRRKNFRKK